MVFHVVFGNRGGKDQQLPWEMCETPSHGEERAGGPGNHIAAPPKLENSRSEVWLKLKRIITLQSGAGGPAAQHKDVLRPWETPVLLA